MFEWMIFVEFKKIDNSNWRISIILCKYVTKLYSLINNLQILRFENLQINTDPSGLLITISTSREAIVFHPILQFVFTIPISFPSLTV